MSAKKRSSNFRSPRVWMIAAVIAAVAAYVVYSRYFLKRQISTDVFSLLEQRGYTPNPGFSGLFRPGNIIQVSEPGENGGERALATPLLFAWADECFPDKAPRNEEFTVAQGTGTQSASLKVSGDRVFRLVPSLTLDSRAVANYSLKVGDTRVLAFAKGELSGGFSKSCVEKLNQAIRAGDKVEWFRLILSSVVADELTLEMQWKQNLSADARGAVVEKSKSALSQVDSGEQPASRNSGVRMGITDSGAMTTAISAKGLVILGYQARPIQKSEGP
ncbi:MAG TPA: hypothetical protein VKQ11_12455 [Candidatus Sulfotelmatobacter sp.]|nr:hypothetical protein [Candidatus Sulfotelmatobacter sp.]